MKKLLLLTALLLISCGSRKSEVSKQVENAEIKKETKTEILVNKEEEVNEITTTKVDKQETKQANVITEIEVVEKEGVKTTKTKITDLSNENKIDNTIIENQLKELKTENLQYLETISELEKVAKELREKKTDRKFSILDLWWVLLLIVMIYLGWKKRKELFA